MAARRTRTHDPRVNPRPALAATLLAGLVACAPSGTRMVSSWRDPAAAPVQFQKVLVLCFAPHESQRQFAEGMIAGMMKRTRGVAAYTLLNQDDVRDKEKIKAVFAREGFDGALTMRFIGATQDVSGSAAGFSPAPAHAGFWDYYQYAWPMVYDPGYVRMDRMFQMDTQLFAMKDAKLIWSGLTQTANPESAHDLVQQVAQSVAADLRKQGLIQ
jgi:hypothetical protein